MNDAKAFLDTNLIVYLYSDTDTIKKERVIQTIDDYERFVSTQVINEFCYVCIRKLKLPLSAVRSAVYEICDVSNLVTIDEATSLKALELHERYEYSYYDSLIIASALENGCDYLLSEDMSDGQIIENSLTIINVFSDI
jgi:predicted nucleic acid-binding protein